MAKAAHKSAKKKTSKSELPTVPKVSKGAKKSTKEKNEIIKK